MKRAVYYVARLISSQKEKEFHGDDYNGLKKVYSIWIAMDVQNYRANSIQEYSLTEKVLHGDFHDKLQNYDLFKIIILNLLHLLFMDLKSSEEKEIILHDQYNIDLTHDMRKELTTMGGLMETLLKVATVKAAEETEKKSKFEDIRNAMQCCL